MDIPCGTSGGVMTYIEKVEVVNRLKKAYVYDTIKNCMGSTIFSAPLETHFLCARRRYGALRPHMDLRQDSS
jgi:hypothetical protein